MSFGVYAQFQTFGQSQQLEEMLKLGTSSLEELISRDNFLFDLKAGALPYFVDFIAKHPENFEKMLSYILAMNQDILEYDELRHKKFPYIISEIFAIENNALLEFLFLHHRGESQNSLANNSYERLTTIEDDILPEYQHEEAPEDEQANPETIISGTSIQYVASFKSRSGGAFNDALRQNLTTIFFKFLEAKTIHPTAMGYYAKILTQVVKRHVTDLWEYILKNTNLLDDFLRHIEHEQMVENIVRLIVFEQKQYDSHTATLRFYPGRKKLLDALINQLDEQTNNAQMVDSLCQIFISILDYGNEHKVYELLSDLYDLVLKPQLFFELGKKTNSLQAYRTFYSVVNFIFQNSIKDQKTVQVIKCIQSLGQVIQSNIVRGPRDATFGRVQSQSLGPINLQLLYALEAMIKYLANPFINESLPQTDLLNLTLELMIEFEWNNQLAITVQKIFCTLIDEEDRYFQMLVKSTKLLEVMLRFLRETPQNKACLSKRPISYGFAGALKQISYSFLEKLQSSKRCLQMIAEIPNIAQLLETITLNLEIENTLLCGVDPKTHLEEAPPEMSIDRQMENMLDKLKQQENSLEPQENLNQNDKI